MIQIIHFLKTNIFCVIVSKFTRDKSFIERVPGATRHVVMLNTEGEPANQIIHKF